METYEKVDKDTLKITSNDTVIHIFEKSRAEIATELFHLKADRDKTERDFQEKIDALEVKLAILDEGE